MSVVAGGKEAYITRIPGPLHCTVFSYLVGPMSSSQMGKLLAVCRKWRDFIQQSQWFIRPLLTAHVKFLAAKIGHPIRRSGILSDITIAQVDCDNTEGAEFTATGIERFEHTVIVLCRIALKQAKDGDPKGAKATFTLSKSIVESSGYHSRLKISYLTDIAQTQGYMGMEAEVRVTFMQAIAMAEGIADFGSKVDALLLIIRHPGSIIFCI
jgi:hypothetical protein